MNRQKSVLNWVAWLLLAGLICGFALPSDTFAKTYREIDTEGDPGDGDEVVGSGGGTIYPIEKIDTRFSADFNGGYFEYVVIYRVEDGRVFFHIEIVNREFTR